MNIKGLFGEGTYEVKTRCKNCKSKQMTKIKKGNKAEDVLSRGKCEFCGYQELEEVSK